MDQNQERLIGQCLKAVTSGPFFPEWEFSTLFGLEREELARIASAWPEVDQSDETVILAINNSFNTLLGYPIDCPQEWPQYISVPPKDLKSVFDQWRNRLTDSQSIQPNELKQELALVSSNHSRVTQLQAAIFDCDGLLADTETPDYEAWRTLYAEHGLTLDLADWAQTIGIAKGHDIRDWHAALAEVVGPGYDREAVQARRRAHYQGAIEVLTPMAGVVALLDALDAEGIPYAVASNSERVWVDRVLTITGLIGRFAAIATADEVPHPKPAPDVYLLAAERLGVPAQNCAAFEDSPRGLAAAHAAGMFTVAVPTALTGHLDFAQAHRIVASLEQLTPADLHSAIGVIAPG